MVYSYDEMQGDPSDPMDHEADSGFNQPHNPGRVGMTRTAGDVLPMPGERSMGSGETTAAAPYATGANKDPKVISIGMPTLKSWAGRKK